MQQTVFCAEPVKQPNAFGNRNDCRMCDGLHTDACQLTCPCEHTRNRAVRSPRALVDSVPVSPRPCVQRRFLYTTPKVPPREDTRPTTSCRPGPLTRRREFMSSCIVLI